MAEIQVVPVALDLKIHCRVEEAGMIGEFGDQLHLDTSCRVNFSLPPGSARPDRPLPDSLLSWKTWAVKWIYRGNLVTRPVLLVTFDGEILILTG